MTASVLHPGDVACAGRGERFRTLLGSCVSVVLTDPRRTTAAMCHIVHARPAIAGTPRSAAYADVAFEKMFDLLQARGIAPALCEAYVYGGANMFPGLIRDSQKTRHVGEANVDWVMHALAGAKIKVVFQDTGGTASRKLDWTVGPDAPTVEAAPN